MVPGSRLRGIPLAERTVDPTLPAHIRERVVNAVIFAVTHTSFGARADAARIRESAGAKIERLCTGGRFDFELLERALRKSASAGDEDIYLAHAILTERLGELGLLIGEPNVVLTEDTRRALRKRAIELVMLGPTAVRRNRKGAKRARLLGELLIENGLLSADELVRALRAQTTFGGRLGTVLSELSLITENDLTRFLGVQLGIPSVDPRELDKIPADVIELFPCELATRHRAVPVSRSQRKLRLAMIDPTDLEAIDEARFQTGHHIDAVIAPERLITEALFKYYGLPREVRVRADSSTDLGLWPRLSTELARAREPADVLRTVLEHAARVTECAAIFAIDGEHAVGFDSIGCRSRREHVSQVCFPVEQSALFRAASERASVILGGVEPSTRDYWLLRTLGTPPGDEATELRALTVLPLIGPHGLAGMLLAAGKPRDIESTGEQGWTRVANKVGIALELVELHKDLIAV